MKSLIKIKYFLCLTVAVVTAFVLCGCDLFAVDIVGLLSPPQPSGDIYPIQQALSKSVSGEYTLKYPSSGDRRSAVILEDIDADNHFEAFAFYSTVLDEITYMNVNYIVSNSGEWKSLGAQSIMAGGIEMVEFCDLDNDGVSELIIGWEIYGSTEKQLAVYSCGKDGLSQRMLKHYTNFLCCDLDENDEYEVFIHHLDATKSSNTVSLMVIEDNGVSEIAGCLMDKTVKSALKPVLSTLSSGQPAIYIDEIKGAGAVTEVLYFSQGKLSNPLLDTDTAENTKTLRSSSILMCDINRDGILEIPVSKELPSALPVENVEKFFYTSWCSFNGDTLSEKELTIMNPADGYYLDIPVKWSGNIALSRNTEENLRTVFSYDPVTMTAGETVAYFRVIDEKKWKDSEFFQSGYIEICRKDGKVFIGKKLSVGSAISVTDDELKSILRLIEE